MGPLNESAEFNCRFITAERTLSLREINADNCRAIADPAIEFVRLILVARYTNDFIQLPLITYDKNHLRN